MTQDMSHDIVTRCVRCRKLHLTGLRCWRGRYQQQVTSLYFALHPLRVCWLQLPGCKHRATTVDHVVARSKGGTDDHENLRPCCKSCNSSRGARDPFEGQYDVPRPRGAPLSSRWSTR